MLEGSCPFKKAMVGMLVAIGFMERWQKGLSIGLYLPILKLAPITGEGN